MVKKSAPENLEQPVVKKSRFKRLVIELVVVAAVAGAGYAMWKNPFVDMQGDGYQLSQSLIAIGSGGFWGLGFGRSRQKQLYLPEVQNDFIFAVVCEELGLVGATIVLTLFSALIIRGYCIARRAPDRFGTLLCVGFMTLFAMQTFLNVAVVSGLLPTTGVSLPLFSYGGTALVMQLIELGVVLSISRYIEEDKYQPYEA